MKKTGILNQQLAELVANMGHGDIILIADKGIPMPKPQQGVTCIDLSVKPGMPTVKDVMEVVLSELEVESYIIPQETKEQSPDTYREFKEVLGKVKNKGNDLKEELIPHIDCKNLWLTGELVHPDVIDITGREVKGVVRTGECTPYAYIMLVGGVTF